MSGLWAGQPQSVSYSGWTPAFKCPSDLGQEVSSVIHSSSEVLGHGHCRDPTPNNLAPSYYAVLAGPLFDHCEPPSRAQLPSAPSKEGAPSTSLWVSKGVAWGLQKSVVQCCSVLSASRARHPWKDLPSQHQALWAWGPLSQDPRHAVVVPLQGGELWGATSCPLLGCSSSHSL